MAASLHTLSNGVRVVCDPIDGFETFALSVVIGRGARYETRAQSGWAHLLEHMVFKGAGDRYGCDLVEEIESAGGNINAETGYERTSFQVRAIAGGLPLAMSVVSDLVFRPMLDPGDFEREKSVIAQEIAEAADTPDDLVFELAQAAAFGDTSLGRPILGSIESVNSSSIQALGDFHRALYAPDRMVISVAGAVDDDQLLAEAERWFGAEGTPGLPEPQPTDFLGGNSVRAARVEQAHLVFMMPARGVCDPDYFAQRLFAEALGGGMSSRLFQEAREKRGLAYSIDAYAETYAGIGAMGIYAGCAAKDAVETAQVAAAQVRALRDHPLPAELARAKAQLKGSLFMSRESALSRAEQNAGQTLLLHGLVPPAQIAAEVDAVTLGDIARVGERALSGTAGCAVLGSKLALAAADAFAEALAA